jgi:DNA-binding transcriptional ArsR family regulator
MSGRRESRVGIVYQYTSPGLTGTLRLESPDALKALAHPLRSALLRELKLPKAAKELAVELNVPVARLYHHLKLLQKVGVIVVADERRAGSNVERRYRVAAARIEIAGTVAADWAGATSTHRLEVAQQRFRDAVDTAEAARRAASDSDRDPLLEPWTLEAIARLDEAQARALVERLRDAVHELREQVATAPTDHGPRFGLQLTFTPFSDGEENRWDESRHWHESD